MQAYIIQQKSLDLGLDSATKLNVAGLDNETNLNKANLGLGLDNETNLNKANLGLGLDNQSQSASGLDNRNKLGLGNRTDLGCWAEGGNVKFEGYEASSCKFEFGRVSITELAIVPKNIDDAMDNAYAKLYKHKDHNLHYENNQDKEH